MRSCCAMQESGDRRGARTVRATGPVEDRCGHAKFAAGAEWRCRFLRGSATLAHVLVR